MAKAKKKSSTSKVGKPAYFAIEVTEVGQWGEDLPQLFERLWKQFQAGDNQALFDLVIWCLVRAKLPPPDIVTKAVTEFIARYDRWRLGNVRSLDAAFQLQRRKGKHVALRVKRRQDGHVGKRPGREQYRRHIVVRVYELHLDEGMPIDPALFEKVAEELGLGPGTVEEIFYERESCRWREAAAKGCLRVTPRKTEN
jgi:hypothetical protein